MAATEEIIKLAARVLVQQFGAPYRAAFERRFGAVVVCGVLAFIAGMAGVVCAVAAFWLWLTPIIGAANAAWVSAAVLLLIALALGLTAARCARRSPSDALTDVLKSEALSGAVEKHLPELVIAAAVGGLIFGLRGRK